MDTELTCILCSLNSRLCDYVWTYYHLVHQVQYLYLVLSTAVTCNIQLSVPVVAESDGIVAILEYVERMQWKYVTTDVAESYLFESRL